MSAKIGVHGATFDRTKVTDADKANIKETDEVYVSVFTLGLAQQLKADGAPDNVVVKTIMTPGADMYWLSADDAKAWNVTMVPTRPRPLGEPTTPTVASK